MEYNLVLAEIEMRLRGTTRSALAAEIGVSASTITRVLNHERKLEDADALEKLGFVNITVRIDQLPKIKKCIKEAK